MRSWETLATAPSFSPGQGQRSPPSRYSGFVRQTADPEGAGLFGPDSASWQVNRETTVLFGGARALLMHAAHPLVLAGARQTGFYERNPWKRLERTLRLTNAITFGTVEEAMRAVDRINRG